MLNKLYTEAIEQNHLQIDLHRKKGHLFSRIAFEIILDQNERRPLSRISENWTHKKKLCLENVRLNNGVPSPSKRMQNKKRDTLLIESPSKWIQTVCMTPLTVFFNGASEFFQNKFFEKKNLRKKFRRLIKKNF